MKKLIYLDHNATTPLRPSVKEALQEVLSTSSCGANPSSIHAAGRQARQVVQVVREALANFLDAHEANIVFTSSGTEANNTVLTPHWRISGRDTTLDAAFVSAVEHPCVLKGGQFSSDRVFQIPVKAWGQVECETLEDLLRRHNKTGRGRALVSVMHANNETGVINNIASLSDIVHANDAILHVDCAQSIGKIPVNMNELGADVLTLSGHKFGAPFGVGAIVFKSDKTKITRPLLTGGGQERNLRAGTENVLAIKGLHAALKELSPKNIGALSSQHTLWRDMLEQSILNAVPHSCVIASDAPRLPNTTLISVENAAAETLVIALDIEGVCVSSGSACSSGKITASHVLKAMQINAGFVKGAIRFSLGWSTTEDDITSGQKIALPVLQRVAKRANNLT